MPIVSVSLTERNIETLDGVKEALGLSGRSEAVRVCLRCGESEIRDREDMQGHVDGVLIVVHDSHISPGLDEMRHRFQHLITTQIHNHLQSEKCLEVFIIRGKGVEVNGLLRGFQSDDSLEYVKFVQS